MCIRDSSSPGGASSWANSTNPVATSPASTIAASRPSPASRRRSTSTPIAHSTAANTGSSQYTSTAEGTHRPDHPSPRGSTNQASSASRASPTASPVRGERARPQHQTTMGSTPNRPTGGAPQGNAPSATPATTRATRHQRSTTCSTRLIVVDRSTRGRRRYPAARSTVASGVNRPVLNNGQHRWRWILPLGVLGRLLRSRNTHSSSATAPLAMTRPAARSASAR